MSMRSASSATVGAVRDFWESHVNNEYYTKNERGSAAYFDEIEERREGDQHVESGEQRGRHVHVATHPGERAEVATQGRRGGQEHDDDRA